MTFAELTPAVALTAVGESGVVSGVTAADAALAGESPTPFVATTVNVYAVPFARPVHAAVSPVTTHDPPAGDAVTAYDVIAAPPSSDGAVHETEAEALPGTAVTAVGADGATACGVTVAPGVFSHSTTYPLSYEQSVSQVQSFHSVDACQSPI